MSNNKGDKSKIDKIKEDLEKKLAALEKTELNTNDSETASDDINKEIISSEDVASEKTDKEQKSSFIDQISSIENKTSKDNISDKIDNDETIFEISDEIEVIPEIEKEEKIVPPVVTSSREKINSDKTESQGEVNKIKSSIQEPNQIEEEKSSKTNFLIYGLIGLLLLVVGYFTLDYLKGKDKLNSDITNKKIDELENRRYQDSIKLMEAEKRLAEFESQRYIDSIAEADRLKLTIPNDNKIASNDTKKSERKVKETKPTTTIYKNNKPVVTSNSNVNFDEVVASKNNNTDTKATPKAVTPVGNPSNDAAIQQALKDEKDKEIAKEVKKEKKIETLNTVAKAPIYPGCEKKGTERAKKTCMITKINKFVNKNFNTYVAQDLGLDSGRQKIFVSFIIDKNGYVNILRTRAKHAALKKEAVRVVNKLPRMKPAIDKTGKKTQLVYNLPIVFSIEE